MTLPTVIEITPQLEAVTPDTFIDRWAAVAISGQALRRATGLSPRTRALSAPVSLLRPWALS